MMGPALVGIGVGPGDPSLITVKALSELRGADRVFGPTMAVDAVGRAESIVRQAAPDVVVERLVFAIIEDAVARRAAHDQAADRVAECLATGERVAFVTLGDPNVYSTFHHLADRVLERRPGTPVTTVPGICAFQDLAARSGTVLVDGVERLHLVSAVAGPQAIDVPLADPEAAVVVYKGGRHLPALVERLRAAGRLDGAVVGELIGLPGERVGSLALAASGPAAYLSSLVVPPRREARDESTGAEAGEP
ncbi:MAG: precorrin-2 C(20)-methyltransferase [Actinomycetota bacterium]|nr:precorrin-2 C(20)-methyltransferase [Actinomycetota bacterium]